MRVGRLDVARRLRLTILCQLSGFARLFVLRHRAVQATPVDVERESGPAEHFESLSISKKKAELLARVFLYCPETIKSGDISLNIWFVSICF